MTSLLKNRLFVAIALLSSFSAFSAKADIFTTCGVDLGASGRTQSWAVFTTSGSFTTDVDTDSVKESQVFGNVGVAGAGDIKIDKKSTIYGDLWYHTGGKAKLKKDGKITGKVFSDLAHDAILDQGATDAGNASAFAFALPVSPQYVGLTSISLHNGQSMTLTGNGCTVIRLTDFAMDGGLLTLQGPAGTAFIINVTHSFSLTNGAAILLSGISPSDVLFNVIGSNRGANAAGPDIKIDKGSFMNGILLAPGRDVSIKDGSKLVGEVIANSVSLTDKSQIIAAATTSVQNP